MSLRILILAASVLISIGAAVLLLGGSRPPSQDLATAQRRLEAGTASPAEIVALGEKFLQRGELLKAAEMGFRARKADPRLPAPHLLLATLYTQSQEPEKARASYQDAVRVAPELLVPRLNLARFELEQRNGPAALEHAQAAVNIDRNSAEAWLLAGRIQRLFKSDGTSASSYRRAITLNPELAEAHLELGVLSLDFDKYSEAVAPLERAYELGLRTPQLMSCLALALVAGPGGDDAATRAEQLLKEAGRPEMPASWFAQGLLHHRSRDLPRACETFERVLRANPRNERAQYALAMAYRDAGRKTLAQKAIRRHDLLVRRRQALRQFSQGITEEPNSPSRRKAYGQALFEIGDFRAAEAQFRAWCELASKNAEAKQWLRRAREKLREQDGAR